MRTIRGLLALIFCSSVIVVGGATSPGFAAPPFTADVAALAAGADVVPLTPDRILDTRSGTGVTQAGTVGPAASIELVVLGRGGVPISGVDAVVVNVTVARQSTRTFVTVWPSGDPLPVASSLNADVGRPVSNLVLAKVGANGSISLHNGAGTAHLIGDVVGWVPSGSEVVATAPARILDTRVGVGVPTAGRLGPGDELDLSALGAADIPATGVASVFVNVTAVGPTQRSFITAYPSGESRPLTATVNAAVGKNVATLAVAKLGSGGAFTLYNDTGTTHLVVDVLGYATSSANLTSLTPSRILDTRSGVGARIGTVGAGETIEVDVTGVGGVPPSDVAAVWLNVGATASTVGSFVTSWPTGVPRPLAASLNTDPAHAVSNLVLVPVGVGGGVSLYNDVGSLHLIADVVAYVPTGAGSPFTVTQRHVTTDAESETSYRREEYDESADDAGDPDGGYTETLSEDYSEHIEGLSGTLESGDTARSRVTDDPDLRDGPPWISVGAFSPGSDHVISDTTAAVQGAQAAAAAEARVDVIETVSQLTLDVRADAAATVTASPDTRVEFPNGDELDQTYRASGVGRGVAVVWFDVPTTAGISLSSDCLGPGAPGRTVHLVRFVGQISNTVWSNVACDQISTLEPGAYRLEVSAAVEARDSSGSPSDAVSTTVLLTVRTL